MWHQKKFLISPYSLIFHRLALASPLWSLSFHSNQLLFSCFDLICHHYHLLLWFKLSTFWGMVGNIIIPFSVPSVTYLKALCWIWCPNISLNSALGKKKRKIPLKSLPVVVSHPLPSPPPFPTYLGAFFMVHHSIMHNFLGWLFFLMSVLWCLSTLSSSRKSA